MSHFTVMAILRKGSNQTLEDLLAPYDENMEVAPYVRYTKAELIKKERQKALELASDAAVIASNADEEAYRKNPNTHYRYEYVVSEEGKAIAALATATDDEVFEAVKKGYYGESLDADGNYLSTYNPNSKWDWYETGGRWSGSLKLKKGGSTDEAKAAEINWDAMFKLSPEDEKSSSEFWDEYVLGKLPEDIAARDEKGVNAWLYAKYGFILYTKEYYLERYKDKEEYLRRKATWTSYAVLDEKGWHAPGEMGWFGCSSEDADQQRDWDENFRSRFIDTLDPEDEVVIVDCHI